MATKPKNRASQKYRSAVTGRYIGEQGRRAVVPRRHPSTTVIQNRKAA